jgi:hypothetical protein
VSSTPKGDRPFKAKKQLNTTKEWLLFTQNALDEFEEARWELESHMKSHEEAAAELAKLAVRVKRSVAYGEDTGDCVLSQRESEEVDKILDLWKQDLSYSTENFGFFIFKIERICNSYLEEKYETTRRCFQRDGKPLNEELGFHGAYPRAVEWYIYFQNTKYSIVVEGFKVGGVDRHMNNGNQLVHPI